MKLSKTQVIALFLSTASAEGEAANVTVTHEELVNANCSEDTVAANTASTSLTSCSTMGLCQTNEDCTIANEVCGTWIEVGTVQDDTQSFCVHSDACDNLGKRNGNAWTIQCLDADYRLGDAWEDSAVEELLNNVEDIVTDDDTTWTDVLNMKVMAWDNFQTGWWIRDDNTSAIGIYTETDKPVNNRCETTDDCGASECCANWPDSNNLRCISDALGGEVQTIAPFSAFTPTCIAGDGGGAPISAEDDIANEALANAAQQLEEFKEMMREANKEGVNYAEMTEEDKAAFDQRLDDGAAAEAVRYAADKETAGFADMTVDEQVIFEAELLQFAKDVWEKCLANGADPGCWGGWNIREAVTAARKADGYYSMTAEEREAWDEAFEEQVNATKATLVAAWTTNKRKSLDASQEGGPCSKTDKCTDSAHCCGTATPKLAEIDGMEIKEITGMCGNKSTGLFTTQLGIEYTHVCGAKSLLAGAAAMIAMTYLM